MEKTCGDIGEEGEGWRANCNNGQEVSQIDDMTCGALSNRSVVLPAWSMYITMTRWVYRCTINYIEQSQCYEPYLGFTDSEKGPFRFKPALHVC